MTKLVVNRRVTIITFIFTSLLLILFLGSFSSFASELDNIQAVIKEKGAQWVAGETSVSRLPLELRKYRVSQRELVSPYLREELVSLTPPPVGLPVSLDWRNYNGKNFVTPIRDQGDCGSCWAFAATAGLESYTLKQNNTLGQDLDLSEQVMVSCSGAGSCSGGYLNQASNYVRDTGLPLESCYRYTETNGNCDNACINWEPTAYKIQRWSGVNPVVNDIKNALYTYGPLPTTMAVYSDFYNYVSGVYSYVTGYLDGYHAILIVGYNDSGQYFIVKNSWGIGWGESGYFKIAYSQVTNSVAFGFGTEAYWSDIPTTPRIAINPLSLTSSCPPGQNAISQTFELRNSGVGTLNYGITSSASWLSCSPTIGSSTGENDTITVNYSTRTLSIGSYSATITITDPGASNSPQTIDVTLTVSPSLNTALDNDSLTFTTGGNGIWFGQVTTSYYGGSAAQSWGISNSQSSWMQTTVTGPTTLSFYKKVSSEAGFDYLKCYLDGIEQPGKISGEVDWQQQMVAIPTGSHTVKWSYSKDSSVSSGSDCAWVDKVVAPRPNHAVPMIILLLGN